MAFMASKNKKAVPVAQEDEPGEMNMRGLYANITNAASETEQLAKDIRTTTVPLINQVLFLSEIALVGVILFIAYSFYVKSKSPRA